MTLAQLSEADALISSGKNEEARSILLSEAGPPNPQIYQRMALSYGQESDLGNCWSWARKTLQYDPSNAFAHSMIAGCSLDLGDPEGCVRHSELALRAAPGLPAACWNLAHGLGQLGRWDEAWTHYEYGFAAGFRRLRTSPERLWKGEDVKRLFVWAEQGHGDCIMALRWLKEARKRAGTIILEVHAGLVGLVDEQGLADGVYSMRQGNALPTQDFDAHISLMSLPLVLGIKSAKEKGRPYLKASKEVEVGGGHKSLVGLVLQGSKGHVNDHNRSMPAGTAQKLSGMASWLNMSLQAPLFDMPDAGPTLSDWQVTSAYLAQLGGLVTVDTGIAHLAGAMGVKTLLIAPLNNEWRWGQGESCPWYRSMKILRPKTWDEAPGLIRDSLDWVKT